MAFCRNCGSEHENDVAFCVSCGKPTNDSVKATGVDAMQRPVITSAPKKGLVRNLIIGGSALVVVVLVVAVVFAPKPLNLSKAEAQIALMQPSDFSFDVSEPEEPNTIMDDVSWVIFDAGATECSQDGEIKSLVQDQGTLLASTDLNGTDVYFGQDIVEFESDQIPTDIVSLINSGYDNSACDYDSDDVNTTLSDLGSAKEKLGIGPETSTYFAQDSVWEGAYSFLSSKTATLAVADGKYLIVTRMSGFDDSLSISEARMVVTKALEKLYK